MKRIKLFYRMNYEGETFSCVLFILPVYYEKLPAMPFEVKVNHDKEVTVLKWDFPGSAENKNYAGPTARFPLPKMKNNLFKIVLNIVGKPELKSQYTFVYRGENVSNNKPKQAYLNGVSD